MSNAVVSDNTGRAGLFGDINVYVLSPIVGFGLLIASDHDAGWARFLDDTSPVAYLSDVLAGGIVGAASGP